MTPDELKDVLRKHIAWLNNEPDGEGANLPGAYLPGAYLPGAYLPGAYLPGANLSGADLTGAYLREADLREANLRGANLRGANLRGANLSGANLTGADLTGADLRDARGQFAIGQFGRHQAIAGGEYISIGCERHEYQYWLDHYEAIGKDNNYTDAEIARYGAWIKIAVEWLTEAEKEQK